jgi:hypothetical protein
MISKLVIKYKQNFLVGQLLTRLSVSTETPRTPGAQK